MPLWSRLALACLQCCRVLLVALALWYFSWGTMLLGFLPQAALALLLMGLIVVLLFHFVCELQTWVSQAVARR